MKTLGIHHEGWKFFFIFSVVFALIYLLYPPISYVVLVLCFYTLYFFRDPERVTPKQENAVISPADGVICQIKSAEAPPEVGFSGSKHCTKVSVFMNVFNVHVNRSPIKGDVIHQQYIPGAFFNASLDKASEHNERNALRIVHESGKEVGLVQIAGLIARRIVQWIPEDKKLSSGERFGLIRFGSRVDLYLPTDTVLKIKIGQKVTAGETVIATLQGNK